jgi:hypothetical protein
MITAETTNNYIYDPQCLYDFSPYIVDLSGKDIHYGLGTHLKVNSSLVTIKFVVEHPNLIHTVNDSFDMNLENENKKYDYILNICPYSCNYLNERFNTKKYIPTFFPLPFAPYDDKLERTIPVFYTGHAAAIPRGLEYIIELIKTQLGSSTYNSLCFSISIKNRNSFYKKLALYNKTKICVCHNVLDALKIPNIERFRLDELFKTHYPWIKERKTYAPQIKSRMFEGAMMGCILLVFKDEYNTTDSFFKENEEFIYFTDKADLANKIKMILSDYDKYKYLAINARKRYLENYTFGHFVEQIKSLEKVR